LEYSNVWGNGKGGEGKSKKLEVKKGGRTQKAEVANGKRQTANGKRQTANGKRQT